LKIKIDGTMTPYYDQPLHPCLFPHNAKNASKNASKMYVVPTSFSVVTLSNPQPTQGLSDRDLQHLEQGMPAYPNDPPEIDAQLCEYEKLLEAVRCAGPDMISIIRSIRKLMSFLLWNTAFLDSLSDAQIQELHGWMRSFHTVHNDWNQEFAESMMKAVRSNKDAFIDMKADAFNPGDVMNVLRQWESYHNEMTATHIDVEVVYENIRRRL
jgi:hypothetical protein